MVDGELILLDFWPSPFGLKVRIALAEKGVQYEYKEENLMNKSQLLLESNPVHQKIPVLIHGGKSACESVVIVQYVDEAWKHSPLLTEDPYERATARFWADFVDKKAKLSLKLDLGCSCMTKGEALEAAKNDIFGSMKTLEGALGDKPFFAGESFGFMDIMVIPFSSWFHVYESHGGFKIEEELPKLSSWVSRCKERDTVSKTLHDPLKVLDFVSMMKKMQGVE